MFHCVARARPPAMLLLYMTSERTPAAATAALQLSAVASARYGTNIKELTGHAALYQVGLASHVL
jgi:hypothetical protein